MGTRFTRVSVIGEGRQIDLSLPADAPLTEQLPIVLRLLSVPTARIPVSWVLGAPEFGPLDPSRSLDEVGVVDGTRLYLTESAAAPLPPFVDDVENAVAQVVGDRVPGWTGPARRGAIATLLAALLVAAVCCGVAAPAPVSWIAPSLVLGFALALGGSLDERGGWTCALVAVPAVAALLVGVMAAGPQAFDPLSKNPVPAATVALTGLDVLADVLADGSRWDAFPLVVILAGTLGLVLAGLARRDRGVAFGSAAVAIVATGALVCTSLDMPATRIAGLALLVAVVLSGLAGRVGLGGAGLVDLMVSDERGEPVTRRAVAIAVDRGLRVAGGLVWASATIGAAACWVLITRMPATSPGWVAPGLGALGGLIFALRSRMFSRAQHVGPMLGVAVVAAAAASLRLPEWLTLDPPIGSAVTLLVLMFAGSVVALSGLGSLREVAGARVQRSLERLEPVATVVLIPGLVPLFGVIPMVQHWWS